MLSNKGPQVWLILQAIDCNRIHCHPMLVSCSLVHPVYSSRQEVMSVLCFTLAQTQGALGLGCGCCVRCGPLWTKKSTFRRAPQERSVAEKAARDRKRRLRELEGFHCVFLRESWIFDHSPLSNEPNQRRFEPLPVSAVPATLVAEPVNSTR